MKLHKRYPLNRLSVVNTTTLLLLMGCAGVGRKPTEAPIELEAAPTSVDGYLAHLSYDENTPFQTNQELYDVDIVEGPAEITFSLEIKDDELASLFEIHPQTGVITLVDDFSPDYEGGDEEFEITVVASTQRQQVRQTIKVTINDINDEAPTFSASPADLSSTINENSQYSTKFQAFPDAALDGFTIRYSLSGNDAHFFDIDVQTGQLTAKSDTVFDHESGKTEYELTILATTYHLVDGLAQPASYDGKELVTELAISITVTDINEIAPIITSGASGSELLDNIEVGTSAAIYEAKGTYDATPIVWSLKDNNSDDAGLFDIDASGAVTFKQATIPDHESGKTSYSFTVIATSGDFITEKAVTIAVTDLNDNAPVITSNSSLSIAENTAFTTTTAVYSATGRTDVKGDSITWSLKDNNSDDAGLFDIDASGAVTFKQATTPDHESGKTSYAFTVVATAGNLSSEQEVTIAVTDVNEAPTINSSDRGAALTENVEVPVTQTLYTARGIYDLVPIVWSLKDNNGDDADLFDIDDTTGAVTFKSATTPDYEDKESYSFTVVATSGGLSSEKAVTIAVTDVAPTAAFANDAVTSFSIEDRTTVFDAVTFSASPVGSSLPVSYGLAAVAGKETDIDAFTIDVTTGVLTAASGAQFEHNNQASYEIYITATTDTAGEPALHKVTVSVNALAESTFIKLPINTPYLGSTIYGASGTDVIDGTEVHDFIHAGSGDDTITTNNGVNGGDIIIGGKGDDKIILDSGQEVVVVTFNSNATASGQWALTSGQDVIDNFHRGVDKIIFVDENDIDQPILTLNDFLYDDSSPLIRGIYPLASTFPKLETILIEFQGNNQKLTINFSTSNRYVLPRYDEEQPTDANNGFLLKSYASFAPFMGGTDTVEFYEIDNLPANVDLI